MNPGLTKTKYYFDVECNMKALECRIGYDKEVIPKTLKCLWDHL